MIEKLTSRQIRNAKPGCHSDGGGLYLQKREGGLGSWIFRYERGGKERWLGLGSLGTITADEAREQARQFRKALLDGRDPMIERYAERAKQAKAAAETILFREAWAAVVEDRRGEWKGDDTRRQWEASLASIDRVLGSIPCDKITTGMVYDALSPIWRRTQDTADKTRGRIEAVLAWAAVKTGRGGEANPARWKNNLDKLLRDTAVVKHHEALPYDELPGFMVKLRDRQTVAARALEFAILTATRSCEAMGARWDEIDGDVWTIPPERRKLKPGEPRDPHVVPLSPGALEVINSMPRVSDFIFVSPDGRRSGKQIGRDSFKDTLAALGVDATAHGFRSTFTDWAADRTNYAWEVREKCLAHAIPSKIEKAYRRGEMLDKRRRLITAWAAFCGGSKSKTGGNVVPLNERRSVGARHA
jgi:integrase